MWATAETEAPRSRTQGPGTPLESTFRLTSAIVTVIAGATAVGVLAGWWFSVADLRTAGLGTIPIAPNTAIGLLCLAAALIVYGFDRPSTTRERVMQSLLVAAALAGLVTLTEWASGVNLGIERLVLPTARAGLVVGGPSQLALATGGCLLLLTAAVVAAEMPGRYRLAQSLALSAALLSIFNCVGWLVGIDGTRGVASYLSMPLNTSALVLLLFLGFSFARPSEGIMAAVADDGLSGLLVRKLLPAIVLLPILLAWVSWHGAHMGWYEPQFAMALFATLALSALGYVILYGGSVLSLIEDERLAADKERLISEGRLRRAVTQAPVPMLIHDDDDILHVSEGWTAQSGYSLDETPTVTAWAAKAQAVAQPAIKRHLEQLALATDTIHGGESTVITKSGDRRTWEFSTTPLGELDPKRRTYLTMAVDLTERKKAEADLRQLNEDLEKRIRERMAELTRANDVLQRQSGQLSEQAALLELVSDGIFVRDLQERIVYWSTGAATMYGWSREEAVGATAYKLLQTEFPEARGDIDRQLLRAGHWAGELIQKTKAGSPLFVESRCTLTRIAQGKTQGVLVFNRDVTAHKLAEQSLHESELRFRAVAETANEGIVSVDEGGTIQYWNPGAARMFGLAATDTVGQPVTIIMPERLRGEHEAGLQRYLPTSEAHLGGNTSELVGLRQDGSEFPLELSLSSWQTTKGLFFFGILRDITERKNAELALEMKADELARSNQELEQFAYVASHDLQEPLRMVSNYTQLLARRYKDKLDADANEFIDFAVEGAQRMQALINDLLRLARVGTRTKEFTPVPADRIVRDAIANLTSTIEESGAEVVIDPLPTLLCDASQLTQVFQNLIGNALKFRQVGTRPVVTVSARRGGGAWLISVRDNGIGIESRHQERIFQMFQRLHARSEYPGTGIGLALCKKIVERHGGRLSVESEAGKGATFSFSIPDGGPRRRAAEGGEGHETH
jgi:PAS domain S-box-containing protein